MRFGPRRFKDLTTAAAMVLFAWSMAAVAPIRAGEPAEATSSAVKAAALDVASLDRTSPVDFETEILPVFKRNCLACHGSRKPKAGLILETPQTIAKGGDGGEVVKPGDAEDSYLFQVAAHRVEDGVMPPKNNKVKAENLTGEELALLKLWIEQGAAGEVNAARPVEWNPMPPALNAIHAVALTDDGQYAACARANRLFVYHLPSQRLAAELTDGSVVPSDSADSVPATAHRDFVQSLAFHPNGEWLASGGYREIKLWRRARGQPSRHMELAGDSPAQAMAVSADGRWMAAAPAGGPVQLWNLRDGQIAHTLSELTNGIAALDFSAEGRFLAAGGNQAVAVWDLETGRLHAQWNVPSQVRALAWVDSQRKLATGEEEGSIRSWEIRETPGSDPRMIRAWAGHEGPVTVLRAGPKPDREMTTGGADGLIRVWEFDNGDRVREMQHGAAIADLAVRKDGQRLASVAGDAVAKLWDAEDGKLVAELKGDRYAREEVEAQERAKTLATAELAYRKSELERQEKELKERETRVAKAKESFEPAEKAFAEKSQARDDAALAVTQAEKNLDTLHADIARVTEAFAKAEQSAAESQTEVKLLVDQTARARAEGERARQSKLEAETFYEDAQRVLDRARTAASLSDLTPEQKTAAANRAADAETVAQKSKSLFDAAASQADDKAAEADQARARADQAIEALATRSFAAGKVRVEFENVTEGSGERLQQATNSVQEARKKLEGVEKEFKMAELEKSRAETELQLAQKAEEEGTRELADAREALQRAEEGEKLSAERLESARQSAQTAEPPFHRVVFSTDPKVVLTSGTNGAVYTWDAGEGEPYDVYRWTGLPIRQLAATDANTAVALTDGQAFSFALGDEWILEGVLGTGDASSPLVDRVTALDFSPDGRWLASGGGEPSRGGEIKIWNFQERTLARDYPDVHSDTVLSLEFSPDGRFLASGATDKFARVVDWESGEVSRTFEGHTHHVMGVAWKADGRTLATSGADHVIKVWDLVKGDRKKNIEGFDKEITSIQFVGVGDEALVSSGDNRVRLLKEDGKTVRDFGGIEDFQHAAAATPDGRVVIGGGEDSVLRVWNGQKGNAIASFEPPGGKP